MKKIFKKVQKKLLTVFRMTNKYAQGLIQLNINNVDEIFGNQLNIKIFKLIEEEDLEIKPATCLEEDALINYQPFKNKVEFVLLDIINNKFSFRNNHLLDDSLNVIYEPEISFDALPISRERLSRCKKVRGTVAYLSNTLPNNYGHWFQYTFPLIRIYWNLIGKQNIDYYYIGDCSIAGFQLESLAKIGIDKKQIINYPCVCDRYLTVVRYREKQNNGSKYTDVFAFRFIKQLFPTSDNIKQSSYPKKIYIKRGNVAHRKVVNENEILKFLDTLGFVALVMDGKTLQEQADIFSSADFIVAPHGSALTNLVFVRPNTKVIELFPFNYPDTFNFTFACYASADYYYVNGEKVSPDYVKPIDSDILIDIPKLEKICKLANLL